MKFVVDDGRVFNNYEDCAEYERTHGKIIKYANLFYDGITLYDEDGNISQPKTDISNTETYWEEIIDILDDAKASYFNIKIENNEWQEITDFIYEEYGIPLPPSRGLWRYDWSMDKWVDFSTDMKNFLNMWSKGRMLPTLKVIV